MATFLCARALSQIKNVTIKLSPKSLRASISRCQTRSITEYTSSRSKAKLLREMYKRRLEAGPEKVRHPSAFGCWNHDAEIYAFGQRFQEDFDETVLKLAFRTRSIVEQEMETQRDLGIGIDVEMEDNSELANKGRALASRYIKAYLRYSHPQMFEEGICAIHDYLLSDDTLHHVGSNLGLRDLIQTVDYPPEKSEYITTFLAVIGALLESQGEKRAELFVLDFIIPQLVGKDISDMWHIVNPMGLLGAVLKGRGMEAPDPRLLWSSGTNTIMAVYHVGIYSDKQLIGKSPGESVIIAEEMAARDALKNVLNVPDNRAALDLSDKVRNLTLDYTTENKRASAVMTS